MNNDVKNLKNPDLVRVENLKCYFTRSSVFTNKKDIIHAVDRINWQIRSGEIFGLVGESGCGKSTFGKVLAGLINPTNGSIFYKDKDTSSLNKVDKNNLRAKIQMIFQDPLASLDPRKNIYSIVSEGIFHIGIRKKSEILEKVAGVLDLVGIPNKFLFRLPHELSGGQRQRVAIARALILNPEFLIADEPTSSLDISVQSHILNLFKDLQKKLNLAVLFISHDLAVVKFISNKVGVMYLGKIVELSSSQNLFEEPMHPYTRALLSSIPKIIIDKKTIFFDDIKLQGDPPSPINIPPGCRFAGRCYKSEEICKKVESELIEIKKDHFLSCHFPELKN
ncbi:MAG: ATP-binding cassette domain-containing protein [Actinobacteria bacterium]|nr:ATP-binding cassette domain-containing protein [Actinomycetota bacterium]